MTFAGPRWLVPILASMLVLSGCSDEADGAGEPDDDPSATAGARNQTIGADRDREPATAPTFGQHVQIRETTSSGAEPGVVAHPDGALFVFVWTTLHRSTDGGATFETLATPFDDNGDSDMAVSTDGTLHYVGMPLGSQAGPRLPHYRSPDLGDSWGEPVDLSDRPNNVDRQWMSTGADGLMVLTWNDIDDDRNVVRVSYDDGSTWTNATTLASPRATLPGPPVIHKETIVQPLSRFTSLELARSLDRGTTWETIGGPSLEGEAQLFPVAGYDERGLLYLAASVAINPEETRILVWTSDDDGDSWSGPTRIGRPSHVAIMPWMVAGASGRVAISYYEQDSPNSTLARGPWHVAMAVSNDADLAAPDWEASRVTPDPVRDGEICTNGAACTQESWTFKDFFEMTTTTDGRPFLAWMQDGAPGEVPVLPSSNPRVMAAVAVDGWAAQ